VRAVAPRVGLPEVTLAEEQPDYLPLTVAVWKDPAGQVGVLTRWRPSREDLVRLAAGEDLYISLLTFGQPMQPMVVQVGAEGWAPDDPRRRG